MRVRTLGLVALLLVSCGKVTAPQDTASSLGVTATPESLFVRRGGTVMVDVTVARQDVEGAITISAVDLPAGVTAAPLELAPGATSGQLALVADAAATQGVAAPIVRAEAGTVVAMTPGLRLLVGGAPGTLDESFGNGGTFVPSLNNMALASRGLAISPAGIVVTGFVLSSPFQAITVRVRDDGSLDPAFGSGGFVSTGSGPGAEGIAIALDGDAIVVAGIAGGASASDLDMGVLRYTGAGELDATFASSGVATFNPGVGFGELHSIVVAPDRSILVTGTLFGSATTSHGLRYSPTGVRDTTFNIVEMDAFVEAAVLQSDGKLVLAGAKGNRFWITRYRGDGSRDPGFGTGGEAVVGFGNDPATAFGLVALPGGKLLAAGICGPAATKRICLAQLNGNGSLDVTFGTGGSLVLSTTGFDTRAPNALIAADGKLLLVGSLAQRPAIARMSSDGSLDTSFGTAGITSVDFGVAGTTASTGAFGVGVDGDGRIVIASDVGAAGAQRMGLARLWP